MTQTSTAILIALASTGYLLNDITGAVIDLLADSILIFIAEVL